MVKVFATAKKGNSSNVGKAAVLESVEFQMSAAFLLCCLTKIPHHLHDCTLSILMLNFFIHVVITFFYIELSLFLRRL